MKSILIKGVVTILLVSLSSVSCTNNPVRKKLANPHSSYYQRIHAFAAKLDGNKKAEAYYRNKKNIGRKYVGYGSASLERKNQEFLANYAMRQRRINKAKRNRINNCKTAKTLMSGYKQFVGFVNAGISTRFGDSPVKGYQWGKKAASKQSIPKAVNAECK